MALFLNNTHLTMKAIIYIRVSTDVQDLSVSMQEAKCVAYCNYNNYEVAEVIKDVNVSAKIPLFNRPGGKRLLNLPSDVKHIVTIKLDRMFRNTLDCLKSMEVLEDKVSVSFIDMGGQTVDTSTAMGKWFLTILSSMAELERNMTSDRTKEVLRDKKRKGEKFNGTAPYGYKFEGNKMVVCDETMKIVKDMIVMRTSGSKLIEIKNKYNLPNYNKIYRFMKDEFYSDVRCELGV